MLGHWAVTFRSVGAEKLQADCGDSSLVLFAAEAVVDYSKIITIEPDKRSGKPCIRGLRMTVTDVLEYLASGMTPEEIVNEFPDLTLEDVRACLAFAASRERKLAIVPLDFAF